jgi:hypothetical protein
MVLTGGAVKFSLGGRKRVGLRHRCQIHQAADEAPTDLTSGPEFYLKALMAATRN